MKLPQKETTLSEVNRVERLLESIDNSVACNGREYVKQYLVTQIALNQFGNTRQHKATQGNTRQHKATQGDTRQLEDLKTQLNWVRSNEG